MSRSEPSPLGAAVRLVLQGLRARGLPGGPEGSVPRRRIAVERRGIRCDPRRVKAFLAVTGGTKIPSLATGPDALLSPAYAALWEGPLALELLSQAGLPFPRAGLIHLESEVVHLRPLSATDAVRFRLELDRAEPTSAGLRLTLQGRSWNAAGQLCLQDTLTLLLRSAEGGGPGPARRTGAAGEPAGAGSWEEVVAWQLRSSHGRRYARVSGDYNPIHLWSWTSRPFGFQRPILHGYCTQALVTHALIERRLGGDPVALRRLQIAFRAPLLLPARARLEVASTPSGATRFRVSADDPGRRPYAEGSYVGGQSG